MGVVIGKMDGQVEKIFLGNNLTRSTKNYAKIHADLHKGLFLCEAVQKCQCLFLAVKVQRNDNVLTHDVLLL